MQSSDTDLTRYHLTFFGYYAVSLVIAVVIGMLMIAVVNNPINPFMQDKITVIRNEGKPDMEIITKEGQKVTRFKASGASGAGDGEKAGTAYRMKDGTMVYVPAGSQ